MLGELEWYESLVILASAIPIALAVNAIRITLTGVMYTVDAEIADKIFHDWAGYFMMPLALGMLFLLQKLLSILLVTEESAPATVISLDVLKVGGLEGGKTRNRRDVVPAGVGAGAGPLSPAPRTGGATERRPENSG
jgi:exosortase/archaeosortase family protein